MINRNTFLKLSLVGTLGLFSLTGCNTATPEAQVSAAAPVTETSQPAVADTSGLDTMAKLVADTKAAVESDDWTTAKVLGGQIEGDWKDVEDGIKDTNKTAYDAVEIHLDGLNSALKEATPDKAMVLGHLSELATTLGSVSQ